MAKGRTDYGMRGSRFLGQAGVWQRPTRRRTTEFQDPTSCGRSGQVDTPNVGISRFIRGLRGCTGVCVPGEHGHRADKAARVLIAYVTPMKFPDDSAGGQRMLGMARTFQLAGHQVVIGTGDPPGLQATGPSADQTLETHALGELPPAGWSKPRKALRQLSWGARTIGWLDRMQPQPDVVIVYGGSTPYMRRLIPWCRTRGIPIVVDAVEWYESSHLPGGALGPSSLSNALAMRRYYPKARNVIAISRFLQRHYEERGCLVVRVPPTRDVARTPVRLEERSGPLLLAYAGVPGRKDLIDRVIQGVVDVNLGHPLPRAEFAIAGPSVGDVMSMPSLRATRLKTLPPWLQVHGRVSSPKVNTLLRGADFMPLLRPRERYSAAGFPTKVTESLAAGTPIICNATSDLADYLTDGREALLCGDSSPASFAETLERAVVLPIAQRTAMRVHARSRAEASFDHHNYVGDVERFLSSLRLPD